MEPEENKYKYVKSTYSWYLSRGDSGYTDHPQDYLDS